MFSPDTYGRGIVVRFQLLGAYLSLDPLGKFKKDSLFFGQGRAKHGKVQKKMGALYVLSQLCKMTAVVSRVYAWQW